MKRNIKLRLFEIIEKAPEGDKASKIFDIFIINLIILNVIAVILASFETLKTQHELFFYWIELISVIIFTIEYLLRLWTSKYKFPHKSPMIAGIKYVFSFMALIDLAAILPFYLPMIVIVDLRFLRILRLTRLLRVLKINRYTESLEMIKVVLYQKKEELSVTMFITFLLLLLSSSIMYYVETDVQPDAFPNIIASFWWGVATLTTVGYGDVYPITVIGKILSGIIALLGIGLVALPTGIISSGFMDQMSQKRRAKEESKTKLYCPYCGEKLKE
ncbi:MAG: ion transporter [Eubacteriales bacterium]